MNRKQRRLAASSRSTQSDTHASRADSVACAIYARAAFGIGHGAEAKLRLEIIRHAGPTESKRE
jgi:hypothetical protein